MSIDLYDYKGDWCELIPSSYDTRGDLTELWCTISWGCAFRNDYGYEVIPVPVFTEWWPA